MPEKDFILVVHLLALPGFNFTKRWTPCQIIYKVYDHKSRYLFLPEIWCAKDGQTDRQMEGQRTDGRAEKWHIEVSAPLKKKILKKYCYKHLGPAEKTLYGCMKKHEKTYDYGPTRQNSNILGKIATYWHLSLVLQQNLITIYYYSS